MIQLVRVDRWIIGNNKNKINFGKIVIQFNLNVERSFEVKLNFLFFLNFFFFLFETFFFVLCCRSGGGSGAPWAHGGPAWVMDCIPIRPLPNLVHGPLFFFFFSFLSLSLSSLSFSVSRGPVVYFRFFLPAPDAFFRDFRWKNREIVAKIRKKWLKFSLIFDWFLWFFLLNFHWFFKIFW